MLWSALIDCHNNWRTWLFLFVIPTPGEIMIFHLPSHLCTNVTELQVYSLVLTKPLQQHYAFLRFSIRIERWMVVMESHYRARCPHNKSALRITMVGIAGGLLPLEPKEQKNPKINIALLQHSLLLDTNVIPTPQRLISSLLYNWGVRKEKLDPATSGSKKNDHCTAKTLV